MKETKIDKQLVQEIHSYSPIYNRLYWIISVILIVLMVAYSFFSFQQFQNNLHQYVVQNLEDIQRIYQSKMDRKRLHLASSLTLIKRDKELLNAFVEKDAEKLYKLSKPIFDEAFKPNDITHFYFHDINGVNFLRVHAPKRKGDKIERYTLSMAMAEKHLVNGLEMGVLGTSTYRSVLPWKDESGQVIGYIELGVDISAILNALSAAKQQPLFLASYKKYLYQDEWQKGAKVFGKRIAWDAFPEMVVAANFGVLPRDLTKLSSLANMSQLSKLREQSLVKYETGIQWQPIPVYDVQNRNIGDIFVALDLTPWFDEFYFKFIDSLVIFLLLGAFLLLSLRYYSKRIETAEMKAQTTMQELSFMASFDQLTGLANRKLFLEELENRINEAERLGHTLMVCFIDLDNFKEVNDTFGHATGDELLREISQTLKNKLRNYDLPARFGGDEFALILPQFTPEEAIQTIERIHLSNHSIVINNKKLYVSTSIGIAEYPSDGTTPEQLLKNADTAMYHAKQQGKNRYSFFRSEMNDAITHQHKVQLGLREALNGKGLQVYYQPQFDIKTRNLVGFEALVRCVDNQGQIIPPTEFIPVAEKTDLINELDDWVFEQVCQQYLDWSAQGYDFRIDINLSAKHLKDRRISSYFTEKMNKYGIALDRIGIEITENILIDADQALIDDFVKVCKQGMALSLDDFGTGYSSLSYLKSFPVSILKIDKAFVQDAPTDKNDYALVEAIVAMGHSLGLKVIAEGIETVEHEAVVKRIGCDRVQGYLYQRPLPPKEINLDKIQALPAKEE